MYEYISIKTNLKQIAPITFRPKLFVKLYQLQYCVAMTQICIFPNCNGDTGDYDVIKAENSTLRVVPP